MGAITFRYYYVITIPTIPTMSPVSPQGAAGQQPPLSSRTVDVRPSDRSRCSLRVWSISCIGKILIYFVPGRPVNSSPFHPSSGCHMATHFMLAHKAVPHGCRHLLFTTMCSTIPTSPAMTPVSPHGAAGQQKQTPPLPPSPLPRLGPKWCRDTISFRVDYGSRTYFPTDYLLSS